MAYGSKKIGIPPAEAVGFKSSVRYYCSGELSVPNNTWKKVPIDTKVYDGLGEFDPTTNRFTTKESGYYLATFKADWSVPVADKAYTISIRKNGTNFSCREEYLPVADVGVQLITDLIYLNAGDYLEFWAYQYSGSTATISGGTIGTFCSIHRLS